MVVWRGQHDVIASASFRAAAPFEPDAGLHACITKKRAGRFIPALSILKISSAVLAPLDLGDLVGLGPAGGHDLHGRALLLADQGAGQR